MLVIYNNLCSAILVRHFAFQRFQTFFVTKAVVSIPLFDQLFCIFQIKSLCIPFTLHIRSYSAIFIRTLIVNQPGLFQCTINDIQCTLYKTFLVCIFNPEDKISIFMFCDQISIQRCP